LSPPRSPERTRPLNPGQRWQALTAENRDQILNALSRVVAEHLTKAPPLREVTHDRS
jgi:hypothetical protein